jgi:protein involved in polysaccharide export with SLBB domain
MVVVSGCSDTRISVEALRSREAEIQESLAANAVKQVNPANLALAEKQPYRVAAGDTLSLNFTGLTEAFAQTTLRVRVHSDGRIAIPMAGRIEVAGLTFAAVEQRIVEACVPKYVSDLTVYAELIQPEATTVLVSGAAAAPGIVSLRADERNVLYAVARAGGFGDSASGTLEVRPIDPGAEIVSYDLNSPDDVRRALVAAPLHSGDTVFIEPSAPQVIYAVGLFNAPGPIPIQPNSELSLVRAVASAGGLLDFLEPKEATLWRHLADGEQVRVKLALNDIMMGEADDIALMPGDVLEVPHTAETRFRAWLAQNIQIGPFGIGVRYDPLSQYNVNRALRERNNRFSGGGFATSIQDALRYGLTDLFIPPLTGN